MRKENLIYFAPMEGIVTYRHRNIHHRLFGQVDKYFTPFLVPTKDRLLTPKERAEVLPENNEGMYLVPQIMTNQADDFLWLSKVLKEEYGYDEVNLNLGCPSGTVVSKGRGSGFLARKEELAAFLYEVFSHVDVKVSIKTRIGKDSPDEFPWLMEQFNQYPLEELIIHPRIQKEFYKGTPHRDVFAEALKDCKNPVCYNGDIFTLAEYEAFCREFPQVERVMFGRGLVANPWLCGEIRQGTPLTKEMMREYHDALYEESRSYLFGDAHVLNKMKELWYYMHGMFTDSEKYAKKIRKVKHLSEYEVIVDSLFREQEIKNGYCD